MSHEAQQKALKAVSDAFVDNQLNYEECIHVMACYIKHIGRKCGDEEMAAVLMIRDLDKLMPKLRDKV